MPKPKKDRFEVEQVGRYFRCTCTMCGESSALVGSRYRARKWAPIHARTELYDDFDPVEAAAELMSYGYDLDE